MPIYEYECHSCGQEFEQIQGWSEGAPACNACGSDNVARRLSPPAIHFKGSGWYITDSKTGKGKNGANSVAGANGASKDGDGAKDSVSEASAEKSSSGESKSDAKAESKGEASAKKETSKDKASA